MNVSFYRPHSLLKEYIKGYTISSLSSTGIELIPGGYPAMGIVLDDAVQIEDQESKQQYNFPVHFLGQVTEFHRFTASVQNIINVIFEPWAPYELFGLPQWEFANTGTDGHAFIPEAEPLHARLRESRHNSLKCIEILDSYFLALLSGHSARSKIPPAFFRHIQAERGNLTQKEILSRVYMGKTKFHEEFKNVTGISSKMYCRIIRFNRVYSDVLVKDAVRWKELIYDDYYDQAHFIKEFRHFTAASPSKKDIHAPGLYQHLLMAAKGNG